MDEVIVNPPDSNGIVRVYIPDAEVLKTDADELSIGALVSDTGVFTSISSEEKIEAFSLAQINMEENAKSDKNLLNTAKNNAKKLLEEYIINVGKQIGQNYKVEWIDNQQTIEGVTEQ